MTCDEKDKKNILYISYNFFIFTKKKRSVMITVYVRGKHYKQKRMKVQ